MDLTCEGKIAFHCYIRLYHIYSKAGALKKRTSGSPPSIADLQSATMSFHIVKQGPCIQNISVVCKLSENCQKIQHMSSDASSTRFNQNTHNPHTGDLVVAWQQLQASNSGLYFQLQDALGCVKILAGQLFHRIFVWMPLEQRLHLL